MQRPFDLVVAEHGATVLRVCRAVLGSHADADDAWSETFLSALRAWPDLPETTNVQAWLVTVAHRRSIDVLRRRKDTPVADAELLVSGHDPASEAPTDPSIWQTVAALPERQRHCVAYRYLGELSHAEIAGLLGCSEAASRRATADGLAALRGRLGMLEHPAPSEEKGPRP